MVFDDTEKKHELLIKYDQGIKGQGQMYFEIWLVF